MKRRFAALMSGTIVLSAVVAQGQQGRGGASGPPPCSTLACDVLTDWGGNYRLLIGIAEAMPEDKYGFKPTPQQQSFAERLMHVANIDLKIVSTLGGKTATPMINAKATTKADVVAALRQVNDYGAAVLKEFNDQQFTERVASLPFMGPTTSRARIAYFAMTHSQDIYGQLAVYLRLNGVTPPASVRP